MNPIQLSHRLKQTFSDYLKTTFNVNRDLNHTELASAIERSLNVEGSLTRGPYLEITPPYVRGESIKSLVEEGVLSSSMLYQFPAENLPLPLNMPLYQHQEKAIRQVIQSQHNIVVSSGTGSGKTESFLIPILNDLLLDPTPSVRALLIYPLNALVNDQLARLQHLLKGTEITFGRYTSELEENHKDAIAKYPNALPNEIISREQIRNENKIPQILITNYAMLEYLLIRPEDSELFTQGAWRFLVLDEAHTYAGAQGIEVGMLIRRLKQRLGKERGQLRCIATSATLTTEDAQKAQDFAENLFDETFHVEDIIFGNVTLQNPDSDHSHTPSIDSYLHDSCYKLLDAMRTTPVELETIAIALDDAGFIPNSLDWEQLAKHYENNPHGFVWEVMRANTHLMQLRRWMLENQETPVEVSTAADYIFREYTKEPNDKRQAALYHLIELGTFARETINTTPLLPARYHLFMRSPQGVWVCVNPNCSGKVSSKEQTWSRVFATTRENCDACECKVYPLSICRECGQPYLKTYFDNNCYLTSPNEFATQGQFRYLTWENFQENRVFGSDDSQEEDDASASNIPESSHEYQLKELNICVRCGDEHCPCEDGQASYTTLYRIEQTLKTKKNPQNEPYSFMQECPRCRSTVQKDSEVATSLSVSGLVPLSTVTYDLYRDLPSSGKEDLAKKPGGGRKLLTFYDSRQGAARFTAFMQDVANKNMYTRIMPQAVKSVEESGRSPSLERVARKARDLAHEHKLFSNDSTLDNFWRKNIASLRKDQQEKLETKIQTELLSEITTHKRRRQSLESLGILAVNYFDKDESPDFSPLASKLNLTTEQTCTLIEYLLDDLRNSKAISLPEDVEPTDEAFGNYQGHPVVIRGGKSLQINNHQIPWIGKTERKQRHVYMRSVLEKVHNRTASTEEVQDALIAIWDWLTSEDNQLLVGAPQEGYRLDYSRLLFTTQATWYQCKKCQRLNAHSNPKIPCPHKHCGGELEQIDINAVMGGNYFYNNMYRDVVPLRIEEHTAQLTSQKGREYQEAFQKGDINILSCSTTFEMGIDLGDLQAVVMSNVPPTVANYRQRAGRAGRRIGGTAFILTWASDSPHDQSYFRNPPDIIRGQVRVPYINMNNPIIQRRHINAILLSQFLRFRVKQGATNWKTLDGFFDEQIANADPHYLHIDNWLINQKVSIDRMLAQFAPSVGYHDDIENWLQIFRADMQTVHEKYTERSKYYHKKIEELSNKVLENLDDINRLKPLIKDLQETRLIDYLSENGILPSYSFPLYAVELRLPSGSGSEIKLQRDLKQAIREYAPGSEIVADKRIWRSDGISFYSDAVRTREYRICKVCNHLQISKEVGMHLDQNQDGSCPICRNIPKLKEKKSLKFITPDGFWAGKDNNGKPARQYVRREISLMRSALIPQTTHDNEESPTPLINYSYDHRGKLLYVNESLGEGFFISLSGKNRGSMITNKKEKQSANPVTLGHEQMTDTLYLRFSGSRSVTLPKPENMSFWLSLMYALIQGASRALQIESKDIDGVLYPRRPEASTYWEQTIVLYDNVPGGAGHVNQIRKEFSAVIRQALQIVNCTDCAPESSCYHCLRSYSNQHYHHLLKRSEIVRFLEALLTSFNETTPPLPDACEVVAIDKSLWLYRQIESAKEVIYIASNTLTLESPMGVMGTWADLIQDLLNRKVKVVLKLRDIEINSLNPSSLSVAKHLQLLIERGMQLEQISQLPDWHVIIDPTQINARAIQLAPTWNLDAHPANSERTLFTCITAEDIGQALNNFNATNGIVIKAARLNPPQSTEVINYIPWRGQFNGNETEKDLFKRVFSLPVINLFINDRYLDDDERILKRVAAYIDLAKAHGVLRSVEITTNRVNNNYRNKDADIQKHAFEALQKHYPAIEIKTSYKDAHHDRFIRIIRQDGTQARILIGQGLDFIRPNKGNVATYIVIEDPSDLST